MKLLFLLPACAGLLLMTSCAVTPGEYSGFSDSWSNFDPSSPAPSGIDQASIDSMMMTQQIQAEANQATSDAGAAAAAAGAASVPQPMP